MSIDRKEFLKEKSVAQQKENYESLTFENKRDLWVSKIQQIIKNNIEKEQQVLLSSLLEVLKKAETECDLIQNVKFEGIAIKLAEITPREDFISMFGLLNDYSPNMFNKSSIDLSLVSEIKHDFSTYGMFKEMKSEQPKCNCRWTCGDSFSQCTHSECEETSSGCGFLWLFSCKKRDELLITDCP